MNHTELRAALAEDERIYFAPSLHSKLFLAGASTRWPERTRQLREALDENEKLKNTLLDSMRAIAVDGLGMQDPFAEDAPAESKEWEGLLSEKVKALRAEIERIGGLYIDLCKHSAEEDAKHRKAAAEIGFQVEQLRAEIELLKGAMAADEERLRTHGTRVGLWFGCDTAEQMADEIERLRQMVATWESLFPMSKWAATPEEADQILDRHYVDKRVSIRQLAEIERLKAAGRKVAAAAHYVEHEEVSECEWVEACKVFE